LAILQSHTDTNTAAKYQKQYVAATTTVARNSIESWLLASINCRSAISFAAFGFVLTRWENPDAARCSSLGGCTRATDFPFSRRANKLQKKGNFIRKHFVFGLANCRQKRKERVFYCPEIDDKTLGKIWEIQYFVLENVKHIDTRKIFRYSMFNS